MDKILRGIMSLGVLVFGFKIRKCVKLRVGGHPCICLIDSEFLLQSPHPPPHNNNKIQTKKGKNTPISHCNST